MREVIRLTFRNLAASRLRFLLTTFAVLMGVSFVVSSFVLTDGLIRTFDNIVEDANAEVDAQVRARSDFDEIEFSIRPFDESLIDVVNEVDGVVVANPVVQSAKVIPIKSNGDAVTTTGAPVLSFNWSDSVLNPLRLTEGVAPTASGEFVIDLDTADSNDLLVGETYDIVGTAGREPFQLVGLTSYGEENVLAGAAILSFTLDDVQRLDGSEGVVHSIDIAGDVDPETLVERLDAALPAEVEAVTSTVVVDEAKDDFTGIVNIFGNVLLGFALVAVFVSTFIISNTFNILLGQRVRQLALIRALGASGGQVRFSSILEALIIGIVASVLGLGGGVLLALGLRAIMSAGGMTLPSIDIILSPRTIIIALVVGIGVTLFAAMTPARRAATIPPVAAMRAGFKFGSGEGTRRTIIAIVLAALGISGILYGLFASPETAILLTTLAGGAVFVFVAVSMFAPLFSSPSASFLGFPIERLPWAHTTGHMARENAASNNKRTASTAAGLMIGLALIGMATVVASSLKSSFRAEMGSTLTADFLVTENNAGTFSNQLAGRIESLPEFDEVSAVRYGTVRVNGNNKQVTATDFALVTDLLEIDVVQGDPAAAAGDASIAITQDVANDNAVAVGDQLAVEFAATGTQQLTVEAIYDNEFLIGNYAIDLATWDANFAARDDDTIAFKMADGVDTSTAEAALAPLALDFPQLEFETNEQFRDRIEGQLDSLLVIINVFLGLAILIALLGITNTMALSVLERTQEIGLMRAIGMTRRQTRSMIRLEAAIVSLFGALLGIAVGIFFGWLAVTAIPESIISRLAIPFGTLAIYAVIATFAGLIAASFPARRAARLNVLDAIAAS